MGVTTPTDRERIDRVIHDAIAAVKGELRAIYLKAAQPALENFDRNLTFCQRLPDGFRRMELRVVIIPRVFDSPLLPRIVLTDNGVFHCAYCEGCPMSLRGFRHLDFHSMKEFSPEEYANYKDILFRGIEKLNQKTMSFPKSFA